MQTPGSLLDATQRSAALDAHHSSPAKFQLCDYVIPVKERSFVLLCPSGRGRMPGWRGLIALEDAELLLQGSGGSWWLRGPRMQRGRVTCILLHCKFCMLTPT